MPPEYADEAVFTTFAAALREAADGEALVIALDHVNDTHITEDTWTTFLVPRLIKPIMQGKLEPVRVIVEASERFRSFLTGGGGGIATVPLTELPGERFRDFVRRVPAVRGI